MGKKKKSISFSQYLLDKGMISKEQLEKALAIQNKDRLLGSLALEMKILSENDLLKIKEYQDTKDLKFGEAAISLGLITSNQLKYLLDVRLRRKIRIGEILVKEGFIEKKKLYQALMHFEKNRRRLKTILVCDPSAQVDMFLKEILEKYDYQVSTTEEPAKVLKMAIQSKPDLLIISQVFGDVGLDICKHLLSRPDMERLSIVFTTEDMSQETADKAFESGIHHFLKKPVEEYELLNIIYNIEQRELEKKKEKILVVDDSELIRQVIARGLKKCGYTVFQASNGEEAVALAKSEKPDLITMDILMPGIDGYKTCEKLRKNPETHDIPVIMITSCDSMEEREKGFEAGAVEYFIKPFEPKQLANYVKMLFESKTADRKEKVVVIEDTESTLHIIKHILTKQGIEVITAKNGKEGLEKIDQYNPDLIISDIYMPEKDGFQVCHDIKVSPKTRHTPFIILSSSGKKKDVLKGLALGANDYIIKPFDEDELLGRVNNLLVSKRLYEELKSINIQLEEKNLALEKLHKEKESFYSILTHDLGTPLTSILGFSNLLLDDLENSSTETIRASLKAIKSSGERQSFIIDDALEIFQFGKGKALEMEEADLGAVLHDVIGSQIPEIKKKELSVTVNGKPYSAEKPESLSCSFNKSKISRVIENLISNSLKYADKSIGISYKTKKNVVEVRVEDDGKGIPKKYKDKVFQDFFQISGNIKGTGLGLSSAKRIIKAHKGKIWFDSEPGKCVFHFTLPC